MAQLCGLWHLHLTTTRLALNIPLLEVFAWCNSIIVLHWLDGNPQRLLTFVGNRISNILEVPPPTKWNHVPTLSNPVDCTSRGLLPQDLRQHKVAEAFLVADGAQPVVSTASLLSTQHTGAQDSCVQCSHSGPSRVDRREVW